MSGKARLGGSRAAAPLVRREDLDDNVTTYQLDADGRSAEERVQHVRIDRVEPSPFQVRRVFPEREIEELADSIRDTGLIHQPKGRPHPAKPGWVELMPGELRLRALQRLIERGEAEGVLKRDGAGNWLAPIVLVTVDDERAESIVFTENEARTDLSAWEWALAWQQRRDRRKERGQPATVRDVAAAHHKPHTTVGEYLRVADALSMDVLGAAGVVAGGGPDHGRMARLPFSALKGIAAAADQGTQAAAERLLQELRRIGDRTAAERLQAPRSAVRSQGGAGKQSFQINIRQPLPDLSPQQATHYLGRISTALPVLARRAAEGIGGEDARSLADTLEETARLLRQRA
ncbi:MAG TPA: ParB N-terminal domain-containing protein [Longimicrobiaceae bacterium]|nr:ParB N-terminal domain-containing protein [Longimicrobiaceae bacterium]